MIIDPKIRKIIEKNPLAFATIRNNKPYVICVACCKVVSKSKILITDNFMKATVQNIVKNSNVALVVWNRRWEGYQFLGKAKYYQKGKWLEYVKGIKENKGLPAKGAVLVTVNKVIKSK